MKKATLLSIPVFFLIALFLMLSCKKEINCSTYVVPPPSGLVLTFSSNGESISDSLKRQIKFFYLEENQRIYLNLFTNDSLFVEYIQHKGFVILNDKIYELFKEKNIKNYYFEFPDGKIDSLWLNMEYVTTCQAKSEKCYCQYPIRNITYNDKEAKEHELSWTMGVPLYVLER